MYAWQSLCLWGNARKFILFTKHTKHSTPLAVADRSCLRLNTPVRVKRVSHFQTIIDSGQHYRKYTEDQLLCLVPNPDYHCELHFTLIKQHQQASAVQQEALPSVSLLTGPITSALTEWTYSAIDHHCACVSFWGHGQLHVSVMCNPGTKLGTVPPNIEWWNFCFLLPCLSHDWLSISHRKPKTNGK